MFGVLGCCEVAAFCRDEMKRWRMEVGTWVESGLEMACGLGCREETLTIVGSHPARYRGCNAIYPALLAF